MDGLIAEIETYAVKNKVPIMVAKSIDFLQKCIADHKPKTILEIGTAIGYSGIKMLEAASGATLKTIEIDEERYNTAKENFEKAGLSDRVELWLGDAEEIIRLATGKFDFILLDGSKGTYSRMLPYLIDLLNKGGVLFADNVLFKGKTEAEGLIPHKNRTIVVALREFLEGVNKDERLNSSLYDIGDGISVSIKK